MLGRILYVAGGALCLGIVGFLSVFCFLLAVAMVRRHRIVVLICGALLFSFLCLFLQRLYEVFVCGVALIALTATTFLFCFLLLCSISCLLDWL
jgi:hypothetical protein